jgi:F-type H+-transporting ATPase subunit gamma
MANARTLRRRIKSIKNTAQITKAMQMVASSRMRKAQLGALAGRPYASLMNEVLSEVTARAGDFAHPLMAQREVRRRAVIMISTDRGLCGALNSNLAREAVKFDKETTLYITAGRKAAQFVARTRRQLVAEFTYRDSPLFNEARAISKFAQDLFLKGEVDAVEVLYMKFVSTLTQKPDLRLLLPVGEIRGSEPGAAPAAEVAAEPAGGATEFQFEPCPAQARSSRTTSTSRFTSSSWKPRPASRAPGWSP